MPELLPFGAGGFPPPIAWDTPKPRAGHSGHRGRGQVRRAPGPPPEPTIESSEEDFQRWVIHTAHTYGWLAVHYRKAYTADGQVKTPVQGDKGGQDLILARDGVVLLPELKAQRGRLSAQQRDWRDAAGGHARVWRPSDRDAIVAELSTPSPSNPAGKTPAQAAGCDCPMCPTGGTR